jgi:hypothetical protein
LVFGIWRQFERWELSKLSPYSIEKETVYRPVTPYDIAATLTARLGMKPPSGLYGQPLEEVVGD